MSGRSPAAQVGLRSTGGDPVTIVSAESGELIGTADRARAPSTVHPGAVYLHQGETWRVLDLDLDAGVAAVEPCAQNEYTQPRSDTDVEVLDVQRVWHLPRAVLLLGRVAVTTQVVGYERRKAGSGELLGFEDLDLAPQRLVTVAYWYALSPMLLRDARITAAELPGTVHAAEHAQIGLLPLFALCDRWDIGGMSTALHPDTGAATIFVYDGHPGGAGITERGFGVALDHQRATRDAVTRCPCDHGCPSCVQSPKCGNGNHPLDKDGAGRLLAELTRDIEAALRAGTAPENLNASVPPVAPG